MQLQNSGRMLSLRQSKNSLKKSLTFRLPANTIVSMMQSPFKTAYIFFIIAIFLTFTGQSSFVTAAHLEAEGVKSDCHHMEQGHHDKQSDHKSVPCTTCICPMFSSLSLHVYKPLTMRIAAYETLAYPTFLVQPIPKAVVKSVFHPPSIS